MPEQGGCIACGENFRLVSLIIGTSTVHPRCAQCRELMYLADLCFSCRATFESGGELEHSHHSAWVVEAAEFDGFWGQDDDDGR